MAEVGDGAYHRGGIRCLRLLTVEPSFFAGLQDDCRRLAIDNLPSDVGDRRHATNWTRPYGRAVQYSLLNRSGRFDDFSDDFDGTSTGKSFHHGDRYPALAAFAEAFPGAINLRLNGMDPRSGLSPHEERIMRRVGTRLTVRLRFHLPIATNEGAKLFLDGGLYHFEQGSIYYFNNGCVHAALNESTEARFHLVWDMWLTASAWKRMLDESGPAAAPFLERVTGRDRTVAPVGSVPVEDYAIMNPWTARVHRALQLERFDVAPHRFKQKLWDPVPRSVFHALRPYRLAKAR
jgi:hypothetical protein